MTTKNNVKDMGIFYYDRVYLCKSKIGGIECKIFNSMDDAKINAKKNNLIVNTQDKLEHSNYVFPTYQFAATIISISKYTPIILDNFILKFKLANMCDISIKKN